ncbi:MAG: hypothetical protein F6K11_14630 [Leptolyngbya sp. SIO3F4]|nr:hypothetical protein [Leptolyngbya sp. SIO3F4]
MSTTSNVPQLPPTDDNEASSLRYEVNPAIALTALTDIYKRVQQYQVKLRHLAKNIHQIYTEGPVVSGWLASEASLNEAVRHANPAVKHAAITTSADSNCLNAEVQADTPFESHQQLGSVDVSLFRHGDASDLMNYLSALENSMLEEGASDNNIAGNPQQSHQTSPEKRQNTSQYYLCQLDSSGQIQAEPCPSEQVPLLSMAIARYRRLNQLITQKQEIETKLQTVVDALGNIQQVLAD